MAQERVKMGRRVFEGINSWNRSPAFILNDPKVIDINIEANLNRTPSPFLQLVILTIQ